MSGLTRTESAIRYSPASGPSCRPNSPEPVLARSPPARPPMTVQAPPVEGHRAEPGVLAILSVFFPNSSDGWSLATASLHGVGQHGVGQHGPEPDFSGRARLLGEATARLHTELAAAFGSSVLPRFALTDLIEAMVTELTQAVAVVPQLREHEAAISACYAALAGPEIEVAVQRIHGDYHLAQVLSTDGGWVVLDFEGEPSVPLAHRRAFAPALRDAAGMLASFDYAARHEVLRHPEDQRLAAVASDWVSRCQDAFCSGYAQIMGSDPRTGGQPGPRPPLLRALVLHT